MCKQTFSGHESDINAITVSECTIALSLPQFLRNSTMLEIPVARAVVFIILLSPGELLMWTNQILHYELLRSPDCSNSI